ncbi:MAG: acyl-CoA dehydrogenase [Gemmatimonadota bacterium]
MATNDADYSRWIGTHESAEDSMDPLQAQGAAAMFDHPPTALHNGAALPPLWHWFYFRDSTPQHALAVDGHARRGGFLPPVPYPRRAIAGGSLTFHRPLILGVPAERQREVREITSKVGRSGLLVFVRVASRISQNDTLCVEEEQQIVYRERTATVAISDPVEGPPPSPGARLREVLPDSRLLFRFSALTYNAHRIHYDRDYAIEQEGYPGLVVHGPLIAMWLLALASERGGMASPSVRNFTYRSEHPAFDGAMLRLLAETSGATRRLEAQRPDGLVAQSASATLG